MIRRLFALLLLCILCISLAATASADILWEPSSTYYRNHYDQFQYMDQTYVVPDGMTANLYTEPSNGLLIKTFPAGTRIYIGPYGTVHNELWGSGYAYGDWQNEGWVRLDRLQKEFSHEDFYAQYGHECVATDDQITQLDIETEIQTWTYPGSGIGDGTIPKEALQTSYNDGVMNFQFVYTDPDGGRWGYVGYFMGRCGWVYLDDPETTEPPTFPQTPENTVSNTAPETQSFGWIWVLIAVLAVITACAIVVLKKKARSAPKGETEHDA